MTAIGIAVLSLALITIGDRLANWGWNNMRRNGAIGVLVGCSLVGVGLTVFGQYSERQGAIKHAKGEIVVSVVNGEHVAVRKESK